MKWILDGDWISTVATFLTGVSIICVMIFVYKRFETKQKEFPRYVINAMSILMDDDQKPGSSYTITSTNVEIIINWK